MDNNLKEAFAVIRATEELKENTILYIQKKTSKLQKKPRNMLRYAAVCCSIVLFLLCGVGGYIFYQTPVSYISVDVNPSVEFGLNRFDRVVLVEAYNEDGAEVLWNLNLKNMTYKEAVESLLADTLFEGYLSKDALLSFTVVSDKEEALLEGIQQCKGYKENRAQCHGAEKGLVEEAHHNGLSFGKYQAFLELSQYDETVTAEDCHHLTMRQIKELISQHTEDAEDTDSPQDKKGHGQGNGYCHGKGHHGE